MDLGDWGTSPSDPNRARSTQRRPALMRCGPEGIGSSWMLGEVVPGASEDRDGRGRVESDRPRYATTTRRRWGGQVHKRACPLLLGLNISDRERMATAKSRKRDPARANPVLYSPRDRVRREGAQEAERQAQHRTRTRWQAPWYRAVCSCRWIGPPHPNREAAERDAESHEREVAAA